MKDGPAVVAVAGVGALAAVCLAGSRWADTTTLCRYVVRQRWTLCVVTAAVTHLAHVAHNEWRTQ